MVEAAMRYPLRRGRWRRRMISLPRPSAASLQRLAAAALLAAMALIALLALHGARADPRLAYRDGLAALREGRFGEARTLLHAASAVEPGLAQIALARIAIETGDGDAATAALQRAAAAGIEPARLHALRAAALLLGDDADAALAEADLAPPGYARFAARVRARAIDAQGDPAGAKRLLERVIAAAPRDSGAWVDLGRVGLDRGDVGGAALAATRALALDGGAPAALTLQGLVMQSRYGPVAAISWFTAALARDPGYVDALIPEAAALGEVGRARESLAAARAALVARPGALQPRYLMAVIAARAGNVGLARRLLQTMDDAADAVPGALFLGGWLAAAQGHDDIAIAKWQQLLDAQPMNVTQRRLLGVVLLRSGDAQGASDTLAPLVARGDADSETLALAARAARLVGDPRAAALHDRAIGAMRGVATPFAGDETVATLAAAATAAPDDPLAAVALVRGLLASGDVAGGVSRAESLARASPGAPPAQLALGDALAAAGRYREAASVDARAADLRFDEPTMLRLVDALGRAGRGREAARTVSLYLSQNPSSLVARRLAGHWQAAAGDPHAAATLEALRRDVGNRDAGLLADLALAWRADPARARRYAAAAYRLAPMNRGIVQLYAAVLARAGDREGARQLSVKAAALANGG